MIKDRVIKAYFVIKDRVIMASFVIKDRVVVSQPCLIREKVVTFRMVKLNMLLSIFLITK